ncbi:hypothetical protein BSFP_068830 [Burkholderia stabilis]|uniref:Uncharacterized protein n=1 Tax=Burkholderia stabilis TaxID=95485 RepID=A0A1Y1BVP2_9BURK|nr:hypothetical protein BSFP_068830 [Burkholderia stabilis]
MRRAVWSTRRATLDAIPLIVNFASGATAALPPRGRAVR